MNLKHWFVNCPTCNASTFSPETLPDGPTAQKCRKCEGHWLPASTYWNWLDHRGERLPEKPEEEGFDAESQRSEKARICPACSRIMTKARVGRELSFAIDRCFSCGGIWLDAKEWASLESRALHDEIGFMFSHLWDRTLES